MYFLKRFIITLFIFFLVLPRLTYAINSSCLSNGYTVLTINGILNDQYDAKKNSQEISLKIGHSFKNEDLVVDYLYNPSHIGGAGDIIDVIQQGLFDQKSDYDLVEMLTDASQKINTQKVLIVAHSQGNFYSNNFYEKVANQTGGIPAQSLGVYSVATPAKFVAGGGKYITSDNDFVIANLAKKTLGGVLVPNVHIGTQEKDPNGHSFTDVYMKAAGGRIISDIRSSLDKLSSNSIQKENEQCINTPKLTLGHKITKSILAVADPVGVASKTVLIKTYQGATFVMNTGANSIAWLFGKSVKLAKSFGKLSLLASAIPPEDLTTGLILDDTSNENNSSSEKPETKENSDQKQTGEVTPNDPNLWSPPQDDLSLGGASNNGGGSGGGSSSGDVDTGNGGGDGVVIDKTPPVITLVGSSVMNITKGELYTEAGATALDETDGARDVVIDGVVDTTIIGVYTITYTATDVSKNMATATRTVNVVASPETGQRKNFNLQNKILYEGYFVVCNADTHSMTVTGNNMEVTKFISLTNWQTPYMQTVNTEMTPNTNMYFIFGDLASGIVDCQNGTHTHDYSQTFYYKTKLGDSFVLDPLSFNRITNFKFSGITPAPTVTINDSYGISIVVPAETSLSNLIPTITVSDGATISPASGEEKDFTQPVEYTVTAVDGSIAHYTVTVTQSSGHVKNFDINKKISYLGKYLLCNTDSHNVVVQANNLGVTNFVHSTNWATSYMQTVNSGMTPNTNFRFIFGSNVESTTADCTYSTFVNDYSQAFYYTTSSGASIVYGTYVYTPPALSSEKVITSFTFANAPEDISISINEQAHEISVVAPYGTDVGALVPNISISSGATISPASGEVKDFTNPIKYTVTAEDSTTAEYIVNTTVLSLPPPDPVDTTPPEITSYKFGGTTGNVTVDPVTSPLEIGLVASEPVDWISIRVEKDGNPNVYKIFYSGGTCVDGTTTCAKTWRDMSKGILTDGVYKVKVYMKDTAHNLFNGYLTPYTITVDTF